MSVAEVPDLTDEDNVHLRKQRGAFFTSAAVCQHLADWAIRGGDDRVLEPSCGEAAFMVAAVHRLQQLGRLEPVVFGSEIHGPSARTAAHHVADAGGVAEVAVENFLARPTSRSYDVVIGNPPYVRYQGLTGDARMTALTAARGEDVVLPQLANSWAPFVVHAAAQLRPGGRLALVVPAELMSAGFAAEIRAYLLRRFGRVRLILSDTALFPGVLTDALLLLAEGQGPSNEIEVVRVSGAESLSDESRATVWAPPSPRSRWVPALTSRESNDLLDRLGNEDLVTPLGAWGRVSLGAVTGANKFFALTDTQVAQLGLRTSDIVQISPPGSGHLRAITFNTDDHVRAREAGAAGCLFRPSGDPSPAARAYIKHGERTAVDSAYKCRIRDPWWRSPLVPVPDLFITYMNGDSARLAANLAGVPHLNSVHGLYLNDDVSELAVPLAVASLNSATLLGAELAGRSYGGGILKLEPGEARKLPVPSIEVVRSKAEELAALIPDLRAALGIMPITSVAETVDQVLFGGHLAPEELANLRIQRHELWHRRTTRGLSHGGVSLDG